MRREQPSISCADNPEPNTEEEHLEQIFSCQTPSDAVAGRKCKFLKKFIMSDNMLCQVFKDVAMDELALIPSNAY